MEPPVEARLHRVHALNLRDHIEHQMREAILTGKFKPGERLVETPIADQLGVSRAPVREVLLALEREGLVVNIPKRGSFVIDFDDKDVEEIYSLRLLLEIGALRRAVNRFSADDLVEMQKLVDCLGELTTTGNNVPDEVVEIDLVFHEHLVRAADHNRLFCTWKSMRLQTQLLMGLTSQTDYDYPSQPRQYHQEILDAINAKDLTTAEALLTVHIQDAQRRAWMALQALRLAQPEPP